MRDWTENQIMLAFIRHGETKANKERRYLGKTDESLSEKGIELLESYKMQKIYPDVEYLFISPMKRCRETAEIIYPRLCPIVIPEWEEIDFGRFEYRNYEELKDDAQYQEWINSKGTLDFPEGESRNEFVQRCKRGFIRMCNELNLAAGGKYENQRFSYPACAGRHASHVTKYESSADFHIPLSVGRYAPHTANVGKPVLAGLIVHGGTIMSLLSLYGGADYFDYQAPNGRGYICRLTGAGDRKTTQENHIQIEAAAKI